jgi:cytochrome c
MQLKTWIPFLLLSVILGCSETQTTQSSNADEPVEVKDDLSLNPDYKKGLALVAQNDCLTCHAIKEQLTGPSYSAIAAKYAGADEAKISMLAQTIIKGGSGNWGTIPMTAHPGINEEDAKQMVKYILLLNK